MILSKVIVFQMEFVNNLEKEKNNQEFAMENMCFTSTLRSLKQMGFDYVKDLGFGQSCRNDSSNHEKYLRYKNC